MFEPQAPNPAVSLWPEGSGGTRGDVGRLAGALTAGSGGPEGGGGPREGAGGLAGTPTARCCCGPEGGWDAGYDTG